MPPPKTNKEYRKQRHQHGVIDNLGEITSFNQQSVPGRTPILESGSQSLALRPRATDLTSLSFSFPICKMGLITSTSRGCCEGRVRRSLLAWCLYLIAQPQFPICKTRMMRRVFPRPPPPPPPPGVQRESNAITTSRVSSLLSLLHHRPSAEATGFEPAVPRPPGVREAPFAPHHVRGRESEGCAGWSRRP
ncbi:protein FMC1 homolog isoform X1 [Phascolarctos cinereus]|uniref:Protein FMC1 homolog isoform X1 n=1 Tax=Phascolarctos cinereus TaxID=38626 RepID=A0A6P5L5V0_PHACI|nr:protein FMC1 homolog isoform X1 [Phascolarctos cinereus]